MLPAQRLEAADRRIGIDPGALRVAAGGARVGLASLHRTRSCPRCSIFGCGCSPESPTACFGCAPCTPTLRPICAPKPGGETFLRERLVFAPQEPVAEYLARFRLADLYVDTFPFGSHTTVNDALFAGLPVVTLAGRSMASRASASQLRALGLPELVATSHSEYFELALELARDRSRLEALATRLRETAPRSPLFDMQAYTLRFEAAMLRMVHDRGRPRHRALSVA